VRQITVLYVHVAHCYSIPEPTSAGLHLLLSLKAVPPPARTVGSRFPLSAYAYIRIFKLLYKLSTHIYRNLYRRNGFPLAENMEILHNDSETQLEAILAVCRIMRMELELQVYIHFKRGLSGIKYKDSTHRRSPTRVMRRKLFQIRLAQG
jgi:hypothetical protein